MKFGVVNSEFVLDDNTEFTKFHVNFDRFGPIRFCNDCELNSIEFIRPKKFSKIQSDFSPEYTRIHLNSPKFT
jgi:hypothetical protein